MSEPIQVIYNGWVLCSEGERHRFFPCPGKKRRFAGHHSVEVPLDLTDVGVWALANGWTEGKGEYSHLLVCPACSEV